MAVKWLRQEVLLRKHDAIPSGVVSCRTVRDSLGDQW